MFNTNTMVGEERKHIKLKIIDNIAVITLDSPNAKVNSLNHEVMHEFSSILKDLTQNTQVDAAVIISDKPSCFIAGADMSMISNCKSVIEATDMSICGQQLMQAIENSKKPFVAAIQGTCLGGGLETALACHYRIAVRDKKTNLGLPEVRLGLLPGAGGTQRLQQLVSIPIALDMILTGKTVNVAQAEELGLIDYVLDPFGPGLDVPDKQMRRYLQAASVGIAKELASGELKVERMKSMRDSILEFALQFEWVKDRVFDEAREQVKKRFGASYPAPLKIIEVMRTSFDNGPQAGYEAEALAFGHLAMSPQAKSLLNLVKAQTECKKNRFGTPKKLVKNLVVMGAGLMGAGIAQVSIDKGYNVVLKDDTDAALAKGVLQVQNGFEDGVKRKRFDCLETDEFLSNLITTKSYDGFHKTDMVIETIENVNRKYTILEELEAVIPSHCILATTTTNIPILKIAEQSSRPDKVIGMHYFLPVDKMQLLEVITTEETSKDTIASAVAVGLKQGKIVITVRNFYTTRLLAAMMLEAVRLLQEGVRPEDLNKLSRKFGFTTGIATLVDQVGLDVIAGLCEHFIETLGEQITGGNPRFLKDMVHAGFSGRKASKGLFIYHKSKIQKTNPAAIEIVKKYSLQPKGEYDDEDNTLRMVLKLVNQAVLCGEEKVLENVSEGDTGAVFGLGFPPFTGGPFKWVDSYGADRVVDEMEAFRSLYGDSFKPAQTLIDMAKDSDRKFYPKML